MKQVLPARVVVLSAPISIYGQDQSQPKRSHRPNQAVPSAAPTPVSHNSSDPVKYTYEFTQPKFYVKHIMLEHDANGRGTVTFERLNEDTPVTEPIALSPAALERINAAWRALQFLDSQTDYQASKQFPHLGTMRIGMETV